MSILNISCTGSSETQNLEQVMRLRIILMFVQAEVTSKFLTVVDVAHAMKLSDLIVIQHFHELRRIGVIIRLDKTETQISWRYKLAENVRLETQIYS